MKRIIHPPLEDHSNLRRKMTDGEQAVFNLFNRMLSPEWEIYIEPHLNGLRPDFVLLNPNIGIAVYEVKDLNLDAMEYYVKRSNGTAELWARKDGKSFSVQKQNPFPKIKRYKQDIFDLYCPRLQKIHGFAAITAGIIFPFADSQRIKAMRKAFLTEQELDKADIYWPVSGRVEMANHDIKAILPAIKLKSSRLMTPELAADLRGWLAEPDFAKMQRQPLELDRNQRFLAETRTETGYRRIKGPAGSGKSLVLAARAAKLADEGEHILIATYNITLWHYLRDLIVRGLKKSSSYERIKFTHFHDWCHDVCQEAGFDEEYSSIMKPVAEIQNSDLSAEEKAKRLSSILPPILNKKIPELAYKAARSPDSKFYDAILVDEGQDYLPLWWNAIRGVCKPGGEMLLVADATQDVYGTASAWTDEAMNGAGFSGGRWAQLGISYRLPSNVIAYAQDFSRRFLPHESSDVVEPDQQSLDIFPCELRWIQCDEHENRHQCVSAVLEMMQKTGRAGLANADITFLANDIQLGEAVVRALEPIGVHTVHTFEKSRAEQKRLKMGFYMGNAKVKATTFHSFKGWEARLLIVHIGRAVDPQSLAAIYVALTRLKRSVDGSHLTIVCSAPELAEFGKTWPNYIDAPC